MRQVILVIIMVLVSGCSTIKYNYTPDTKKFNTPQIGVIVSTGLGEELLDQGVIVERDILEITQESFISPFIVKKGKLRKVGEDDVSEYYGLHSSSGVIIYSGIFVPTPEIGTAIRYDKNLNQYCVASPHNIEICGDISAKREKEAIINSESFRRTLIYTGKVGNKLRMSYREFNNNLARAAFSTDVEYDLEESNIIGYAGARIEVIKATNNEIKYKVLNNFRKI